MYSFSLSHNHIVGGLNMSLDTLKKGGPASLNLGLGSRCRSFRFLRTKIYIVTAPRLKLHIT